MANSFIKSVACIGALLAIMLLGNCLPAGATSAGQGLTITPAIKQITLAPSQTSATFAVNVTNTTASPVTIAISTQDFTTLDQNGGIRFLSTASSSPHALASSMVVATPQVRLVHGQTEAVTVIIQNAEKLATGGHYAAVVFRVVDSNGSDSKNIVSVMPAVSSLVFVTTAGAGTQQLDLSKPSIGSFQTQFPNQMNLVFTNSGNTQTAVHGVVQITDSNGKPVNQGVINEDSGLILPGSQRLFDVMLHAVSDSPRLAGSYTLHVLYRHDGQAAYTAYQQKFFFVNGLLIWVGTPVILLSALLVLRKVMHNRLQRAHK